MEDTLSRALLPVVGHELIFSDNFLLSHQFLFWDNTLDLVTVYFLRRETLQKRLHPENWLIEYDNLQFFMLFRVEKSSLKLFINMLLKMDSKRILQKKYIGGHMPVELKLQVLIFLWYMATQDSLISIADRFKVSHTTVMKIVNNILYFMLKLKKLYIVFPKTLEELETVSRGFATYPGVIGALDGTHVFVKVSKIQQDSYIDRYKRHSINIMAICDSNGLFTYAFIGFPGSAHDSRVFQQSQFFKHIERYGPNCMFIDDSKYHLVADSAFGLKSWLMTPYRDNNALNRMQKRHNYCLSAARVVIEHAFGILKGRWRRLIYINTYNICKTIEIATAAMVLHNLCILNKDVWTENFQQAREQVDVVFEVEQAGRIKRDIIAANL